MNLKDMPWFNRPWERIRRNGITSLSDAELLAVIFIRGIPGKNAIDLSNDLLQKYNFNDFASCTIPELNKVLKNEIRTYQIIALGELFKRYSKIKNRGYTRIIRQPEDIFNIFRDDMKNQQKEYLYGIYLNRSNHIIHKHLISKGTLDSSLVHPREVFKPAIKNSAYSVILVHNHPSNDVKPSLSDVQITNSIKKAGDLLEIQLWDHVIIAGDEYFSFRETKRLG